MEFKYKSQESKEARIKQSKELLKKYPNKVPVILEKDPSSKITEIGKTRYLLERKSTAKEVMEMIRKKTTIDEKDALFLQVRAKFSITGEKTIGDIYDTYKDSDGFLYIMYTTELIYG